MTLKPETQKAVLDLREAFEYPPTPDKLDRIISKSESLITDFTAELEAAQREIDRYRATNPASLRAANGAIRNLLKEYENEMQKAQRERDKFKDDLQINIDSAHRIIARLSQERDQAQAACAMMRAMFERLCPNDYTLNTGVRVEEVRALLSNECGTGWKSPAEYAALKSQCAGPGYTPNSTLPPLGNGPRQKILIEIEVPADFEKRLDNQWVVEREIHADRWSWHRPSPPMPPPQFPADPNYHAPESQ